MGVMEEGLSDAVDPRAVWARLVADRRTLALAGLAGVFAASVYNFSFRPVFAGQALVSVERIMTGSLSADKERSDETMRAQVALLTSPQFATRVIGTLTSDERAEIGLGPLGSWLDRVRAGRMSPSERPSETPLYASFVSRLRIDATPPSLIAVDFRALDPALAASIANKVVDSLVQEAAERNKAIAESAMSATDEWLVTGRDRLQARLQALDQVRQSETAGDADTRRRVLEQEEAGVLQALIAIKSARRRDAGAIEQAIGSDPAVMRARAEEAGLQARERTLLGTFADLHPDVVAVRLQLSEARARRDEAEQAVRSREASAKRADESETARLDALLVNVRKELASLDSVSADYVLAKEQADLAKLSLGAIARRGQAAADTITRVQKVQAAYTQSAPADPRRGRNTLLGAAVGLVLGLLWVYGRDRFHGLIRLPEDLAKVEGARLLGTVPVVSGLATRGIQTAIEDAQDGFADSLRTIRTRLSHMLSQGRRVFVVTSGSPHDGKSTMAASLAVVLREGGASVLLIDADLRRATLHRLMASKAGPGLSEALSSPDGSFQAQRTASGVDFLPSGNPQALSSALLDSTAMKNLLSRARSSYDWVVIDSPPALAVPDPMVLGKICDGVLVVCSADVSRVVEVRDVLDRLASVGSVVLGIALNRMDMHRHSYYYGRAYSYYRTRAREH